MSFIISNNTNKSTNINFNNYYLEFSEKNFLKYNNKFYEIFLFGDFIEKKTTISSYISTYSIKKNEFSFLKDFTNKFDGTYYLIIFNKLTNKIYIKSDKFGKRCIFYIKKGDLIEVSDILENLKNKNSDNYNNFGVAHTIINHTGPRPPRGQTIYKDFKELHLNEILILTDKDLKLKKIKEKLSKTKYYKINHHDKFSKIFFDTIKKYGSNEENIVFLSSGWDSTSILAGLNHVFGPKKIKAVTWKLSISKRSGNFNKFEIRRVKQFSDYFNVPLHIIEQNYAKNSEAMYSEVHRFMKKYGYFAFTTFSHYFTTKKSFQIKETSNPILFSGEISDGVSNLGFAQYISTFHNSVGFKEYSDKMHSYLYGPTFIENCIKNKEIKDLIYDLLKAKFKDRKFDKLRNDKLEIINQFLISFIGRNERFPFYSIKNYKFLTKYGQIKYDKFLYDNYISELGKVDSKNIYSALIRLYHSFHWHGSSVNTLYASAQHFGLKMRLPFYSPEMINFFEEMPENWGRGLEINNVKYPLKTFLSNKKLIDYPINLQSGPHSYLYDVDENYINPPLEWVNYSMKEIFKKKLKKFDINKLDVKYFNIPYIKEIKNNYLKNNKINSNDFNFLYGFLNLALGDSESN